MCDPFLLPTTLKTNFTSST